MCTLSTCLLEFNRDWQPPVFPELRHITTDRRDGVIGGKCRLPGAKLSLPVHVTKHYTSRQSSHQPKFPPPIDSNATVVHLVQCVTATVKN